MSTFTDPQATILFEDMPKAIAALRVHSHLLAQLRPHVDVPWAPISVASRDKPMDTHGMYCVLVFRMWRFGQLLSPASALSDEHRRHIFSWRGAHVPLLLWMQHKNMYADEDLGLYVEELFDTPRDKFAPNGVGIFTADNSLPLLSKRMWSIVRCMFPHISSPRAGGDRDAGDLFWEVASKVSCTQPLVSRVCDTAVTASSRAVLAPWLCVAHCQQVGQAVPPAAVGAGHTPAERIRRCISQLQSVQAAGGKLHVTLHSLCSLAFPDHSVLYCVWMWHPPEEH